MQVGDRNGGGGRLARLVPAVEWLPRYDRLLLRGDVAAGIAVTALVVPKNLGYADIAGHPRPERPLRGGGGRAHLRAVLHVAADLDRTELLARGGRRRRRAVRRRRGGAGGRAGRRDHALRRRPVPALRPLPARLARALPLEGGRHGLPGRRRDGRRDRRAAEADRDLDGGGQRLARAGLLAADARRRRPDHARRRRRRARGDPRPALPRSRRAGRARARGGRPPGLVAVRPRGARRRAGRGRAARPAGARAARSGRSSRTTSP